MSQLNPWLTLLIGFVAGFVVEWLIELWYWRRKRMADQTLLNALRNRLHVREAELKAKEAHLRSLMSTMGIAAGPQASETATTAAQAPSPAVASPPASPAEVVSSLPGSPPDAGGSAESEAGPLSPAEPQPPVQASFSSQLAEDAALQTPPAPPPPVPTAQESAATPGGPGVEEEPLTPPQPALEAEPAPAEPRPSPLEQSEGDDLTRIQGIGPRFAEILNEAGIRHYSDLAAMSPDDLQAIVQAPAWRKVDYVSWITQAQVLAVSPPPQAAGDDLQEIDGIGATYARRLREAGIDSFAALAASDEQTLQEIIAAPEWRKPDVASWIAQARERS